MIYAQVCQDLYSIRKQIKSALEGVEVGRYLEFSFWCDDCCKKNDIDNSDYTSDSNLYNCTEMTITDSLHILHWFTKRKMVNIYF